MPSRCPTSCCKQRAKKPVPSTSMSSPFSFKPVTLAQSARPVGKPSPGTDRQPSSSEPSSAGMVSGRSEEHTSELQSRFDLVCRLLLEKKNNENTQKASKLST